MSGDLPDFAAFWPFYLGQHADPRTRAVHYCGTALGTLMALCFIFTKDWAILAGALVAGYGPAWAAHAFIEHNRPATFTHPFWSFRADYRMLYFAATGRLAAELDRVRRP
jgi:hypothetical protein